MDKEIKLSAEVVNATNLAIYEMNKEEYSNWAYYAIQSCRDSSTLGMSNHGLLLLKKL